MLRAALGRDASAAHRRTPRADRRLPHPAGDWPGRHGHRLRGRTGVAGAARGAQGAAAATAAWLEAAATVRAGGAVGGAAAPHEHRAGLRRRRAGWAALLRDAV